MNMPVEEKYSFKVEEVTTPYTERERNDWSKSKKIILYESEKQYRQFIQSAWDGKLAGKKMYFGKITDEIANQIQNKVGLNIHGYNLALYADNVRKIRKDHGNDKNEKLRGREQ